MSPVGLLFLCIELVAVCVVATIIHWGLHLHPVLTAMLSSLCVSMISIALHGE